MSFPKELASALVLALIAGCGRDPSSDNFGDAGTPGDDGNRSADATPAQVGADGRATAADDAADGREQAPDGGTGEADATAPLDANGEQPEGGASDAGATT